MGLFNLLWWISTVLVMLFQCNPPLKIINPLIPGWCINTSAFLIGTELPNSLLDFIMVAVAARMLNELQIKRMDKWRLSILFAIGSL